MFPDQEPSKGTRNEKMGLEEYSAPSDQVASPPPYPSEGEPSTSSGIVVASRSGNMLPVAAPPPSVPTNGVSVATVIDPIRGSWLLDPLAAPSSGSSILQAIVATSTERRPRRLRNITMGAPTGKFTSRLGNISASFRVVAQAATPATATIQATTRSGNIIMELVSKSPTRTVHFDAYSRMGNVSLLIPRSFSGFVELRARSGKIDLLPALASSARVVRMTDRETVVHIGNEPVPQVGFTSTGDLARLYARSGRLRIGFSGEDSFIETLGEGGAIAKATKVFQTLTVKPATP